MEDLGYKVFNMDLGIYDHNTRMFTKDGILYESYNQVKYGIEDTHDGIFLKNIEQSYLYEGLTKTIKPEIAVEKLIKYFDGFIFGCQVNYNPLNVNKTPIITFYISADAYEDEYNSNALKELKAIIGNLGYCIAAEKKINNYNYVFSLHPKFIYEVTEYVYNNCDGILYHITDVNTYQKIIKNGLIPRSNQKGINGDKYPDRVYFYTSKNYGLLNSYAKDLFRFKPEITKAIILKIDLKDRKSYIENYEATMYRFFDDPKGQNSVFTYENIDPACINVDKIINLK